MLQKVFVEDLDPARYAATLAAQGSAAMSPPSRRAPAARRHRLPVLVRRARRRAVPRARPRRGAASPAATTSPCSPPPTTTRPIPPYMTAAGRAIPVRYNGSVARLTFGPVTAARVRKWLAAGEFDVLHLHEPVTPSLGMLALWIADGPVVATFHTVADPVAPAADGVPAGAAVAGEDLRADRGLGGRPPHARRAPRRRRGRHPERRVRRRVRRRAARPALDRDAGAADDRVPRAARRGAQGPAGPARRRAARCSREIPGARFLVAGRGETGQEQARELLGDEARRPSSSSAGSPTRTRRRLLASVDVYCAPQTGGESFGIVLVEAMSAGATVVASDLGAFSRVLDDGAAGVLFRTGDSADLARDAGARCCATRRCARGSRRTRSRSCGSYDWSTVTDQVLAVYEMVVAGRDAPVGEDPSSVRGARLLELRRGRGESR